MPQKFKLPVLIADAILFVVLLNFLPFEPNENKGLALLFCIAILWLTEAVHVTITALLVPILAALLGLVSTTKALSGFADPNIYLFFGGFALAGAMHFQQLDRIIANRILALAKGNFLLSVILMFSVTAFLSMWMSNTATCAMMLPLALGMLSTVDQEKDRNIFVFVLLGIAFSASIGGMGTLVGSPPNAIVASNLGMSFADWFKIGFPMMMIFMPVMFFVLLFVFKPKLNFRVELKDEKIELTRPRIITLILFVIVAFLWIFSAQINPILSSLLGRTSPIDSFDAIIALFAAVAVVVGKLISWKDVQKSVDWGVLMLFGGGLTLSAVLKDTGAAKILADGLLVVIEGQHFYVIGLLVAIFMVTLTEFTSNTAAAALLVPLFISIAESLGAPPLGLACIVGIGASCAFMMPVATPPNAIVFGSGHIKQIEMIRAGVVLNCFCSVILATVAYFFWL